MSNTLTCYYGDGTLVETLYQWDKDITVQVKGSTLASASKPVIQASSRLGDIAYSLKTSTVSGGLKAVLPNILLQQPYSLILYIYVTDANGHRTIEMVNVPLTARAKPTDYEFTENIDYVDAIKLSDDLKKLREDFDAYVASDDKMLDSELLDNSKNAVQNRVITMTLKSQEGVFFPIVGINKWDSSKNTPNTFVNYSNGELISNLNMESSDYIDVKERAGEKICAYDCFDHKGFNLAFFRLAFYDSDKKYISGIDNNGRQVGERNAVIEVPRDANFVRVSINKRNAQHVYQMLIFEDLPVRAIEYKETIYKVKDINQKVEDNSENVRVAMRDHISSQYHFYKNRFNTRSVKNGYRINIATGELMKTNNPAHHISDFVLVAPGEEILLSTINSIGNQMIYLAGNDYCFYDKDFSFVEGGKIPGTGTEYQSWVVPEGAQYVVIQLTHPWDPERKWLFSNREMYPNVSSMLTLYEDYKAPQQIIPADYLNNEEIVSISSGWRDKTALFYGDSITAMGNNYEVDSWEKIISDFLKLSKYYVRGIGGQTFKKNNKPWFANIDGSMHSRDDDGDMTRPDSFVTPPNTTAHYGYMASWDRIKTQIPDNIKDKIDLIFVFGVNDGSEAKEMTIPQFNKGSSKDESWNSALENKLGGDYNLDELNGAIASTIMKLQVRCPNALIVTGTGWSGRAEGESLSNSGSYDQSGINIYNEGMVIKQLSNYFSIPCIDIWGNTQVNPWNREDYISDTIHPYKLKGKKALARVVVNGLINILPKDY